MIVLYADATVGRLKMVGMLLVVAALSLASCAAGYWLGRSDERRVQRLTNLALYLPETPDKQLRGRRN